MTPVLRLSPIYRILAKDDLDKDSAAFGQIETGEKMMTRLSWMVKKLNPEKLKSHGAL
jgi:hypothetical protein